MERERGNFLPASPRGAKTTARDRHTRQSRGCLSHVAYYLLAYWRRPMRMIRDACAPADTNIEQSWRLKYIV